MDINFKYGICNICGASLPVGAVRCEKCGNILGSTKETFQSNPQIVANPQQQIITAPDGTQYYVQQIVSNKPAQAYVQQVPSQISYQVSHTQSVAVQSIQQGASVVNQADNLVQVPASHKGYDQFISDRKKIKTLLLCIFTGIYGGHYFYAKRKGWGIIYLYTWGFWGIGVIVDIIRIVTDNFKDDQGKFIVM